MDPDPSIRTLTVMLAELTGPILMAAGLVAYILGPFLIGVGTNKFWRAVVYSLAGTCAGLAYTRYEILETAELPAAAIVIGCVVIFNYALLLVGLIVLAKNRKNKHPSSE